MGKITQFIREAYAEMKKVKWPTRQQTIHYTILVVVIALVRGFSRHSAQSIGNVWADLTRATLWVLLPLSLVLAVVFAGQGVIQNLSPYTEVQTLEPVHYDAPKLDAAGIGARAAAQGLDELIKKATEGFTGSAGVMPARGGNPALTDDQMKAVVTWMVEHSR